MEIFSILGGLLGIFGAICATVLPLIIWVHFISVETVPKVG